MPISNHDVEHVARLARLGLSEKEKEKLTRELNAILTYAEKIQSLDTHDVPPTSHPILLKNIFREDMVKPFRDTSKIIANGPQVQANTFVVPKILD
ncbi:MAG: Asp-tRNA(Asn)/Glu-tRNA(Gln) amidotransferase subunit GatC [Candidatus Margulisiibacteriota bacterium]